MKKKVVPILYLILSAATVILNALPTAVKLQFASGPDQYYYEYFSGFDIVPLGYAVWGPLLGGVVAIVLVVHSICLLIKPNAVLKKWMLGLTAFSWIMFISPSFTGMVSLVGCIASTLMSVQLLMLTFDKDNIIQK